jgi:hypothetical protein
MGGGGGQDCGGEVGEEKLVTDKEGGKGPGLDVEAAPVS